MSPHQHSKPTDEAREIAFAQELWKTKIDLIGSTGNQVSEAQLVRLGGLAIHNLWDRGIEYPKIQFPELFKLRIILDYTHPEIGVERPKRIAVDTAPGITSYIRPEHIDPDAPWRLPAAEHLMKDVGKDVLDYWIQCKGINHDTVTKRRTAAAQARSRHSQ